MAKKHWIYIKRGLSEDPKHRAAMGECVWLFMHIIDRADWETGIAYDWKDSEEAADMGMEPRTLRYQRQKLEKLDYIRCKQKQHSQDIRIMEWINPRDYSAGILNHRDIQGDNGIEPSQGDNGFVPSKIEGDSQGDNQDDSQGRGQIVTPTLDSESESSPLGSGLSESDKQEANTLMDAILAFQKTPAMKYDNRDKVPEQYLVYCDFYVSLIGKDQNGDWIQVPTKRVLGGWMLTFEEWKQERLTPEHIKAAWDYANRPEGGFPVSGPHALTNTAVAMKSKLLSKTNTPGVDRVAVEATKKTIDEKTSGTFVPRPANVARPVLAVNKMKQLAERKSI